MRLIRLCPHCETAVTGRRDKTFCSSNCRKRHSENPQNSFGSREKKNRNMRFIERIMRIKEVYMLKSKFDRLGSMKEMIDLARSGEDKELRQILGNKYMFDPTEKFGNPYRGARGRFYVSLPLEAEKYCRHFWNASAYDVVFGIADEPDDGFCT